LHISKILEESDGIYEIKKINLQTRINFLD